MTVDDNDQTAQVSFAAVAGEAASESVAHEKEAVAGVEAADHSPVADPDTDNDTPPEEPVISSLLGGGPVTSGSDVTI